MCACCLSMAGGACVICVVCVICLTAVLWLYVRFIISHTPTWPDLLHTLTDGVSLSSSYLHPSLFPISIAPFFLNVCLLGITVWFACGLYVDEREREMENMYVDPNLHFFVFRILTALWLFISLCLLLRLRLCVSVCVCFSPQGDSLYSWETLYAWIHTQPGFYNSRNRL